MSDGVKTPLQLAILEVLLNADYYALELMDMVAPYLGGSNPGIRIYPVLRQLERDGYLKSWEGYARPPERAERPRRYYAITEAGKKFVAIQEHVVDEPTPQMLPTAIEGYYLPLMGDGQVALRVPGAQQSFIPLFASQVKLDSFLSREGMRYDNVGRVKGALKFLADMRAAGFRIAIDPHRHSNGNIRWVELHDIPEATA